MYRCRKGLLICGHFVRKTVLNSLGNVARGTINRLEFSYPRWLICKHFCRPKRSEQRMGMQPLTVLKQCRISTNNLLNMLHSIRKYSKMLAIYCHPHGILPPLVHRLSLVSWTPKGILSGETGSDERESGSIAKSGVKTASTTGCSSAALSAVDCA